MLRIGIVALVVVGAALAWLLSHEPPRQLDLIDSAWPGDAATRKAASDIPYGPGERQKFDIYVPAARSDKPLPLLVFFHGGGWYKGNRESYGFAGRAFAAQGFVVAVPSYRLVPGNVFPDFLIDGAAAIAAARKVAARYGGDPDSIVLSGHSAGAHIAAMVALDPRYLAKAGVPRAAIKGVAGLSGPYNFLPFTSDSAKNAMGHVVDKRITQPIHYVTPDAPPMLLVTGGEDVTVKPHNAHDLYAALTA
ncbi:MAG: alpha/beta hydrolase, partial [Sphingomonadales bacterium]|nr:alpha/beta hydrolase [Sphingomonadales bacterium]